MKTLIDSPENPDYSRVVSVLHAFEQKFCVSVQVVVNQFGLVAGLKSIQGS